MSYIPPRPENVVDSAFVDTVEVFEGAEIIDALCPVSKFTGHRTDPQACLSMALDPHKALLVQQLMPQLPNDGSPSDFGDFETIADRLDVGTPAEREQFVRRLERVCDSYDYLRGVREVKDKDSISFKDDKEIVDNA